MGYLVHWFGLLHTWVFETLVQPAMFAIGVMHYVEEAYLGTELALVGGIQVLVMIAVFRPLEALTAIEPRIDRHAIRTDVLYTLLAKLGVLPTLFFFLLLPLEGLIDGALHGMGVVRPTLETLFPLLDADPVLAFFAYLVILDLFGYWIHRMQHRFDWWWALHALHHSQRQMTFWTDNRNHVLDDLIVALATALFVRAIGVPPGQFIALAAFAVLIENLSHADTRLWFGRVGERLLVSPRFHRWHHAVGDGHEGHCRGINFGALFPFWDMLFGTADFRDGAPATGIRDQARGVDYGRGWWAQQFLGFRRFFAALAPRSLLARGRQLS
ncbi:MAG: sterol desaturase family protein [Arenimonas sp.]|nr:sterol desaturase family protein [Arenimonas sp.]